MWVLFCVRTTKSSVNGGKNDQKYGIYPFDKLEFVKFILCSYMKSKYETVQTALM